MAKFKEKETNLSAAMADRQPRTMMAGDRSWASSHGTYITGRAYVDGADETAVEMERKWGCDRLRLLVEPELREKFDRQRYLFNQAIYHGELEDVRRESGRMVNAWVALDRAAEAAGKKPLAPQVWEVPLANGTVAAVVPDTAHGKAVVTDGRAVAVYTLEEIGVILSNYSDHLVKAKLVFPGATITSISRNVEDPLNEVWDTKAPLDDPIPF